jgi:hypothetical protein
MNEHLRQLLENVSSVFRRDISQSSIFFKPLHGLFESALAHDSPQTALNFLLSARLLLTMQSHYPKDKFLETFSSACSNVLAPVEVIDSILAHVLIVEKDTLSSVMAEVMRLYQFNKRGQAKQDPFVHAKFAKNLMSVMQALCNVAPSGAGAGSGTHEMSLTHLRKKASASVNFFAAALFNLKNIMAALFAGELAIHEVINNSGVLVSSIIFKKIIEESSSAVPLSIKEYFSHFCLGMKYDAAAAFSLMDNPCFLLQDEQAVLAELHPLLTLLSDYVIKYQEILQERMVGDRAFHYRELHRIFARIQTEIESLHAQVPAALSILASSYQSLVEVPADRYENDEIMAAYCKDRADGFLFLNEESYLRPVPADSRAKRSYFRVEEFLPDAVRVSEGDQLTFSLEHQQYAKV